MPVSRREALITACGAAAPGGLLQVRFGPHGISRLIVGGNPISGTSHFSPEMNREMADYFTAANVKKLLAGCEGAGINTWQSRGDRHIMRLLREYRLGGGRIQWIAQTASELADIPRNIREIAAAGAIGIYHHGSATDAMWRSGSIDGVRDRLRVMRDAGVRVGLGTHIPEVVDYAESKDWDLDFYMTCVYNLGPPKEVFSDADREKMLDRVRQASRQCLIFKVYGATRKCGSRAAMLAALRQVFRYAKPADCVVIGMFPKYSEQVRENCALVNEAIAAAT